MGALASRFHEYKATGMFDGTLSGFWTFAKEPMMDHLDAWDARDLERACSIWDGGLCDLHEYIADMGRLLCFQRDICHSVAPECTTLHPKTALRLPVSYRILVLR